MADDLPTPPEGLPAIRVTAMPADANAYGDIFGGWLMSLMDMGAGLVAASIGYAICGVWWVGFEAPFQILGVRVAACVCLADAAMWFGDLIPFSGLWLILPAVAYVALLQDLFDIDMNDAVLVTVVSVVVMVGLGIVVAKFIL